MKSKKREILLGRSAEQTKALREAVFARCDGACEVCGRFVDWDTFQLDHRLGRGKEPQSLYNCIGLCADCHHAVTTSDPSAAWWWRRFLSHLEQCGERSSTAEEIAEYMAVAHKAGAKLQLLAVKGSNE